MVNVLKEINSASIINHKAMKMWFEELNLSVAPACNMMCNFCSKDSDCMCNGNDPHFLSKSMTPRQAVNFASLAASKNSRARIIKISGPGEPLCNKQTFEVLKRINTQIKDCVLQVNTNGILLKEKAEELAELNVKIVSISMNAIYEETFKRLYSRIIKNESIVVDNKEISNIMLEGQIAGMNKCIELGILVRVNVVYYPDINEADIFEIARLCKSKGIKELKIFAGIKNSKMRNVRTPTGSEMIGFIERLATTVKDVRFETADFDDRG